MNTDDPTTCAVGYELDAVAARTDHSIVFAATQRATGRQVAVKLAHSAEGADALRREVQVLRGLQHPHVVEVVDATATGDPWLVMPIAAASLEDACARQGAFAVEEVIGVLLAIASALGMVHRHRLVHADVKPANILLAPDGRPVLADFGAAHPIGAAPTQFTPTYFVDDGIEGDIASLARCGLHMLGDTDGATAADLRTLLLELARLGDRPDALVEALATLAVEPRWPGVPVTSSPAVCGPPTHPFGARPPRATDRIGAPPRRSAHRIIALVAAAVVLIGAMHVARERITPHAPAAVEVGP